MHAEIDTTNATLTDDEQARLCLSAGADGEAQALDRACRLWRDDAGARQTWHRYHLIGDVMRSAELASASARDARFMTGLRQRLAAEPAILAPTTWLERPASLPPRAPRPAWRLPAALAASFILVAGAFTVARLGPAPASAELTAASTAAMVADAGAAAAATAAAGAVAIAGSDGAVLITDSRLDEFLRVHQAMGGSLRRVEGIVPAVARR